MIDIRVGVCIVLWLLISNICFRANPIRYVHKWQQPSDAWVTLCKITIHLDDYFTRWNERWSSGFDKSSIMLPTGLFHTVPCSMHLKHAQPYVIKCAGFYIHLKRQYNSSLPSRWTSSLSTYARLCGKLYNSYILLT